MRKLIAAVFCAAIVLSLSACVPTKEASLEVAPDFRPSENVQYDFVQLYNDTLDLFEGQTAYIFITDLNIDGDNEGKNIRVKAVCYDDVTEEIAKYFAAAVLQRINDAAMIQDNTLTKADSESFGNFWDKFSCNLQILPETEAAKENGTPVYELHHKAGEAFDLDPDVAAYEEEYENQLKILLRNEE